MVSLRYKRKPIMPDGVRAGHRSRTNRHWRRHNKGRRLRLARKKVGREVQLLEILRTGCGSASCGSRESASARAWTSVSEQLVHVVKPRQKRTSKECNLRTNDRSSTRLRRASIQTVYRPRDHGTGAYRQLLKSIREGRRPGFCNRWVENAKFVLFSFLLLS